MPVSFAPFSRPRTARAGFSLVELMITLVLLAVVVAVVATVMISSQRSKADTEGRIEAQQNGRAISDMIVQDLRTAGYGTDTDSSPKQPPFAYVDSTEIMINTDLNPAGDDTLAVRGVPGAINPALTPLPHKLTGSYLPALTYITGAETVVYTLDVNNDGVVDANDQAQALSAAAQRTPNPNDYELVRTVYGAQGVTNGGSPQAVGLVRGPGAGIPVMFTVYLNSSPTPWDWSNGPIPANRLKDISNVVLKVTTEGRRARKDGTYPRSTLTTEINSIRNSPNATQVLYHVTGYVFNDVNHNGVKDGTELGIPGAIVRLGGAAVAQTSATGFFDVAGAPAPYVVHQASPGGFGPSAPDSFPVNFALLPADVAHDFADTALTGGWVQDTCYVDVNANGVLDPADTRMDGCRISAGGVSATTGSDGGAQIFLGVGTSSIMITAPDSFVVTSTNPVPATVTNGSTTTLYTTLSRGGTGHVTGYVFKDTNKNGTMDAGEVGIPGAWVGVTSSGGTTTVGYATTDASGAYNIQVPNNDPAHVNPYTVTVVPPDGLYPTGATAIANVWVATGATVSGNNFGMVNFTSFQLLADRVLALGTANLLEKEWSGNANQYASKASYDEDLILCSEYVSSPNISVWWNNMPSTPVFDSTFTYQRNAQSSALCIATGSIDTSTTSPNVFDREDVVTGLQYRASGSANFAVWLNQNSSGNEGYLVPVPKYYHTTDNGDVQQILLNDCAGGPALDIIVGTKSPTPYTGTIEVWRGRGDSTFVQDEVYPPQGNINGNALGEIKAMTLRDVTGDGNSDLIVGTRTGDGRGRLHIFRFNTKIGGNRYREVNAYDVNGEVTCIGTTDLDGDGRPDIILGTRISASSGDIQFWRGDGSGDFSYVSSFAAPGPVLCLCLADMGGSAKKDIVYGFRTNESSFTGGARILFTDLYALPPDDVDPAGGTSNYMTTSIASWNFNYRINNTTPGPYYPDLAIAQKPTATTGRLLVFIR